MALQINSFLANSMATSIRAVILSGTTSQRIRIYPDTVPFPSSPIEGNPVTSLPPGSIAEFANISTTVSNAAITISGGNTTVATTAAGNVSWIAIYTTGSLSGALTSNSVSLTDGNGIIRLNTLTPTSGQLLTVALSLKIVG